MGKGRNTDEYILCAAIHYKDGIRRIHQPKNIRSGFVICGFRHSNCIMTLRNMVPTNNNNSTQGFLTSKNRFVDRQKAAKIAFKSDQIEKRVSALISEELY